jgi:hypothetical protein
MTHDPSRFAPHPAAPQHLGALPQVGKIYPGQPPQAGMTPANAGHASARPSPAPAPHEQSSAPPKADSTTARTARPSGKPGTRKKSARPSTARPRRTSGPSRAYVAAWAVLAGVSMAYLAVLTVQPEAIMALGVPVIPGDPESNLGQRFTAKLASDVQSLQQTVNELQGEVSALRSGGSIAVKAAARTSDFQALEAQLEPPKMQARLGTPLDGTRVAGMVITGPGVPPPATAAPTGPIGLELVTGPSVDALRLNWGVLAERHGTTLKNLEVKYVAGGPNGPFKLLAGPVASAEEGSRICEQFRVKGTPCKVGPFQGNGF